MLSARCLAAGIVGALALAGCGGDDARDDASGVPATTAVPSYEGDPDSPFCRISRESAGQPVLDPFAADLEPHEVRMRFESLAERFDRFTEVAPDVLADDLALLDERFDRLGAVLEDADHDFTQLAAAGEDLSIFDDPALADVATRLTAYQAQVCGL